MHWASDGSHTGFGVLDDVDVQSALVMQPTHVSALLHLGVALGQSASTTQFTHWLEPVSQYRASGLVQSESRVHTTHHPSRIPVVAQAGPSRLPTQSALVAQGWHVWLVASHLGVPPLQSASTSQVTHVPLG